MEIFQIEYILIFIKNREFANSRNGFVEIHWISKISWLTEEDAEKVICRIEHEDIKSGLINRATGRNIFRFLLISKEF